MLCLPSEARLCLQNGARLCLPSEARLCLPSEARLCLPSEARHHLSLPQELAGKPAGGRFAAIYVYMYIHIYIYTAVGCFHVRHIFMSRCSSQYKKKTESSEQVLSFNLI